MRCKTKNTVLGKPEKVRKMSVDIGGCYVVVLVVRKGARVWRNAEQTVKAIYASARTVAGKADILLDVIPSQAR